MPFNNIPSLEEAKRYIDSIDFSQIIHKMVTRDGWLRSDALKVCQFYRNYLYLRRKYGDAYPLPPSKEIDEMWHHHILDTKKYHQDCLAIFGTFHHHYPYFGFDEKSTENDLMKAFEDTQNLYSQEFNGQKIYKIRNIYSTIAKLIKKKLSRH